MNTPHSSAMSGLRAKRFGLAAVLLAAVVGFIAAWALTRQQPGSRAAFALPPAGTESPASFAPVAKAVIPAVVNIDTTAYTRVVNSWDFWGEHPYSVVPKKGRASGFVVRSDGHILTNQHVIAGAQEITVTFADGKKLVARVVGQDQVLDLAVIKVDAGSLPAVVLGDSSAIEPGDWAIAIGNPFGLHHTVTVGVISALSRPIEMEESGRYYEDLIQTDAYINQGNSGGPLLNARGQVVGINTMIFAAGSVPAPIGFAIPVNRVKAVMEQLIAHGKVVRSFIGVRLDGAISESLAQQRGIPESRGVVVAGVFDGSPAGRTGISQFDIIVGIQGKPVSDAIEAARIIRALPVGATVSIDLLRVNRERRTWERRTAVTLKTVEAPANLAPDVA